MFIWKNALEITARITEAIEASLNHRGYEVVQVRMTGGKRQVVAIDIDRLDGGCVTVEDCTNANNLISAILDVENFIRGAYTLEVSSPGESRPIKKISDFERFCGKDVKMELSIMVNNCYKFDGRLLRVEYGEDGAIVYLAGRCDTGLAEISVPHNTIKKAIVKRF